MLFILHELCQPKRRFDENLVLFDDEIIPIYQKVRSILSFLNSNCIPSKLRVFYIDAYMVQLEMTPCKLNDKFWFN